jgi:hypothetical protein
MRAILTSVSPKAFVVVGSTVTKKPPGPPRVKKCSIGRRGRAAPSWYEVETMRAQRFDADDVATIKRLAEKGFPAVVIAKALSGDRTAEAVRKKCVQVGIAAG